jgi:hypothetical protein
VFNRLTRSIASSVATVAMATGGTFTLTEAAQAAPAVSCAVPAHSVNGEGAGYLNGAYALGSASYDECSNVTTHPARAAAVVQPNFPTWTISRNIYLGTTAGSDAWVPYAGPQEITIGSGWYNWQERLNGTLLATRSIYLKGATYYFECYLADGTAHGYNYRTQCQITGDSTVTLPYNAETFLNIPAGNYVWTSTLDFSKS